MNIVNHRLLDGLPDDGFVMFSGHHEADFSLEQDLFPAIGVSAHAGPMTLPDGKESRLCLHFVSGYEYCCEIDESEIPNT